MSKMKNLVLTNGKAQTWFFGSLWFWSLSLFWRGSLFGLLGS